MRYLVSIALILFLWACSEPVKNAYQCDLELLQKHTELVELVNSEGGRICISPKFQGRVLTSSCNGINGVSNGWINREVLHADKNLNGGSIGGEDRLWIGPLGGQYSFYYQQIQPLSEDNWEVPASMNEEAYHIQNSSSNKLEMWKDMDLHNFQGTHIKLQVKREITMLEKEDVQKNLNYKLPHSIQFVAYESHHTLYNTSNEQWRKETGLASIWSAGMFEGTDASVVIIPLKRKAELKEIYQYMGELDSTRLRLINNQIVIYKTDGAYRSKIGIPPTLAPSIYGAYKPETQTLTIVQYKPSNDGLFSNSDASVQEDPYKGEVIPIYNNGPMDYSFTEEHSFFELESTSAMKELSPGASIEHYHRIYHFKGDELLLKPILNTLLKVDFSDL